MGKNNNVTKENPRPLYIQLKENIREKIDSGEYKPGDALPTESWLCQKYEVSRVTVRKAINELENDGLIQREFGKAPRVLSPAFNRNLNRLTGLYEELQKAGLKASSYILEARLIEPEPWLAEKMLVAPGAKVLFIDRLRYANASPIAEQHLYINDSVCPGLDAKELVGQSLYDIFEKKYKLNLSEADQVISATQATMKQCALLELPEAEKAMLIKVSRATYLANGDCVEYSDSYYVSSRYQLSMKLHR